MNDLLEAVLETAVENAMEAVMKEARHTPDAYRTRPIKGKRRTRVEIETLKEDLYAVVKEDPPMTCRQIFYKAVGLGAVDKTEAEYKNTVCRLLVDMRRTKELPYTWIADNTRWMRKPETFSSLDEAVQQTAQFYRRRLWDDQDCYAEVWLEKDALAGVLLQVTERYDVPLMVTRGYPSLSFLHSAAEGIASQGKPAHLFYLGDHDPSGVDIPKKVYAGLRDMAPDAEIHFERIAVNPDQIEAWTLPTRPTKKSDTRAKNFKGESVEVDAIPAANLRQLVETSITSLIDKVALNRTLVAEQSERELAQTWADALAGGAA